MKEETCSACGVGPVSHFICRPGTEPSSMKLCQACWGEQVAPGEKALLQEFMASLAAGTCRFCGDKAATVDSLAAITEGPNVEPKFLCLSCFTESNTVAQAKLQAIEDRSDSLTFIEQSNRLREIAEEVDTHMRRWLPQRFN